MLRIEGITKRFPGVLSLDAVDFDVAAGEVHALVGENGAGKSTLIKVIAGAYQPDAGTIEFAGERRAWASPQAARAAGIHVIYQELVLFPELTVAENVMIERGAAQPSRADRPPRDAPACRRGPGRARDRARPAHAGQAPVGRRPADARDRQGPDRRRQAPDPRRADRGDLGPRGRAAVRTHAPPARPRGRDHLHLAPARGGVQGRRSRDGAEGRPPGRHLAAGRARPRSPGRQHGRARAGRHLSAQGRRGRAQAARSSRSRA